MARHYHVEIAAFVADADQKWIDNLLTRSDIPGVEAAKQGVSRRISADGIRHIALARRLMVELSVAADRAVSLAQALLDSDDSSLGLSDVLSIQIDRSRFDREIDRRLSYAVESIVPARRGRPPSR